MNQRKHLTLVAAGTALLAALPLASVFQRWTWLIYSILIIAAMCGVAVLVRSVRAPAWAATAAMVTTGLAVLTWLFPGGEEILGIIPTTSTFAHFNELLQTAATEMSEFTSPVEDRRGFLFLTTLGVGAVAVVTDLLAVVLRRPALTGLPMLAIYSVPVAVSDDSVNLLPFALGAAGFLWLLVTDNVDRVRRFGRRFTGNGRDVDLWEPSPLAAAGQRLGLVGIAAAVLLPLAVPGMTTGLLERFGSGTGPGLGSGGAPGRSVSMAAMLSGSLLRDRAVEYLKVTNVNDPSPFYLRFGVADDLRSDGFVNRQLPTGQPVNNGIPPPTLGPAVATRPYRANVEILNFESELLPTYTYTTKVEKFDNSWVYDRTTQTIYSGRQTTKKKKYTIDYLKPEFTADDLKKAPTPRNDDPNQRWFTSAPAVPYVKDLVQRLTKDKQTQYDKVEAIFDHFSTNNNFVYDLSTGSDTSGTKIVDFLENKRGYCVQYSAAMGWLLREAKIPARVAFGFTRGGVKHGNTLTLTNFNLHAWTEIYFQGFGWVPFDPTPATAIGGSVSPMWAPNPSPVSGNGPNDDTDVPRPGQSAGANASTSPTDPALGRGDPGAGGGAGETSAVRRLLVAGSYVAGGGLLLLLLASPALARLATRRRRLRAAVPAVAAASTSGTKNPTGADGTTAEATLPPVDDASYVAARKTAHQAWDELLDTMNDFQIAIDEAESPRATGARLIRRERLRDQAEAGVLLLSAAEEHARYARRPLTAGELRSALGAVRGALAVRASRRVRIMAFVLPPSVIQRWRLKMWRRFTDMANALGGWRDRVARALSVRRLATTRRAGR